ncbi:MAG: hypothetical protein CVV22_08615 [Ignavibacteriae bacterium HGW-Ignavibacteriae-1]|jgi:hypothetical protein|nr:MAG: hypothetical protein CVV22_08615 [Ignavibacteriae bacterium HGW-Ignavibacteriae-1]
MNKLTCTNCAAANSANAKYCSKCGHALPQFRTEINTESVQTHKSGSSKIILGLVLGLIAFGLTSWAVQQIFFAPPSFDKVMMAAASELNKSCPMMVDQYTRLDNTIAMPNNSFQYNYTLVDIDRANVNLDTMRKYVEPSIINNVKTNPDMKIYRDNQTTFVYYYKDKNGEFAFKVNVTPEMYE